MKLEQNESEWVKRIASNVAMDEDIVRQVFRGLLTEVMTDMYSLYDGVKEISGVVPHLGIVYVKVKAIKTPNKPVDYIPEIRIEPTGSFTREIHRLMVDGETHLEETYATNFEKGLFDVLDVEKTIEMSYE